MAKRFNPPPGWPPTPRAWKPSRNWRPDPSWPSPPEGWCFWKEEPNDCSYRKRSAAYLRRRASTIAKVTASGFVLVAILIACTSGPKPTPNWYEQGLKFASKGVPKVTGSARGWCTAVLRSGKAQASGSAPSANSGKPAQLWLRGCIAGSRGTIQASSTNLNNQSSSNSSQTNSASSSSLSIISNG